jgi:ATP-dependent RNA helicase DOB1
MKSNPLHNLSELPTLYNQYAEKVAITMKIKTLKKTIAQANSIIQLDELKARKRVLRRYRSELIGKHEFIVF